MSRFARIESSRVDRRLVRFGFGATVAVGLAVGGALGASFWHRPVPWMFAPQRFQRVQPAIAPAPGQRSMGRYAVDVLRVIDGDTFEARVHIWMGHSLITRVRLRGVDAPEMKARCAAERLGAERALDALRALLAERNVTIWNIGPDKYLGRIDADVGTARTPDISAALLAQGLVRAYDGGRRFGWC